MASSGFFTYLFGAPASSSSSGSKASAMKARITPDENVRSVRIEGGGRGGGAPPTTDRRSTSFVRSSSATSSVAGTRSSVMSASRRSESWRDEESPAPSSSSSQVVTRVNPRYKDFTPGLYEPPSVRRSLSERDATHLPAIRQSSSVQKESSSSSTSASTLSAPGKVLCCDKCDGKHATDDCPYYKKNRDSHPDAQKNFYKKLGGTSSLPGQTLRSAKVIRQPGDGSCLFHSMSHGLSEGNASRLRAEICEFIRTNPQHRICETPLEDWIKWDSGGSCGAYASKMSRGGWGGGIEMAVTSHIKACNVHVYERGGIMGGFRRISAFDHPDNPERRRIVKVLYQGGVHYDALV